MKSVLKVEGLTKKFDAFTAGEIVGLLDSNRAGKTTIIQILLNTMTPTTGSIYFDSPPTLPA